MTLSGGKVHPAQQRRIPGVGAEVIELRRDAKITQEVGNDLHMLCRARQSLLGRVEMEGTEVVEVFGWLAHLQPVVKLSVPRLTKRGEVITARGSCALTGRSNAGRRATDLAPDQA